VLGLPRALLERSTRDWVFTRRLPDEFGRSPIFVTPSAGLKYLFKDISRIDPPLFRSVRELVRPGDVVWDIGANVGLFSFAAASRAGQNGAVFAFEADTWLVQVLRRSTSIQLKASAPVSIIPAAIASEIGLRSFTIASRSRSSNALSDYGHSQMGRIKEKQTVVSVTLDWCLEHLPRPNVIKCDVEGAELEVFRGQSKVLGGVRPAILCEVGSENASEMTSLLAGANYRLYDGEKPLSRQAEVASATWSMVGIPEESMERYLVGD
jgi:FkbM family methyltransferase